MRLKLRHVGNSIGIILPRHWLIKYQLNVGDELVGNDGENSIILTPQKMKVKYKLRDLVAQSSLGDLSGEDSEWLNMKDVGKENYPI